MTGGQRDAEPGPVLLCYDGSAGASAAIARAGAVLGRHAAMVVTAWEPFATWVSYDPSSLLTAPVSRLAAKDMDLDELAEELAARTVAQGVEVARAAGFTAEGRAVEGKPWRAICDLAEEIDASAIVLGARGRSRVESVLLGSVSAAVATHARRPVLIVPPSTPLVRGGAGSDREAAERQRSD